MGAVHCDMDDWSRCKLYPAVSSILWIGNARRFVAFFICSLYTDRI